MTTQLKVLVPVRGFIESAEWLAEREILIPEYREAKALVFRVVPVRGWRKVWFHRARADAPWDSPVGVLAAYTVALADRAGDPAGRRAVVKELARWKRLEEDYIEAQLHYDVLAAHGALPPDLTDPVLLEDARVQLADRYALAT